ncbi:MAG: DinB family protein [Nakamurella sp.]
MDEQLTLTSERAALTSFLDQQREGLIKKILGLDDAQARSAPSASALSLLGLIKHAATWEERWCHVAMAGGEASDGWPEVRPDPRDADCFADESDTVEHWVARYREEIERSRAVIAGLELDSRCARVDIIECNVRYVLFHLIEETARHAGHADIIRESIDGSRGF